MPIPYLSPTSFIKYLNCAHHVKLLKVDMVLTREAADEQSLAMATGTAFDAMCKSALNRRFKLAEILKEEILNKNKCAIPLAQTIFDEYYSRGPLQALKAEGIGYGGVDQETELEWTDPEDGKVWKSVCRGLPDLVLTTGNVIDWKLNGAFGNGATPKEGWARCFYKGKDLGAHYRSEESLDLIHKDWAIQTYLYARILGHKCGAPLRAGIEQVAVTKDNDVYCASFRNPISNEFQIWCERTFHRAFEALNAGTTEVPRYHARKCLQYNRLCNVAEYCDGYKVFKNPVTVTEVCPAGYKMVGPFMVKE